MTFSNSEDSLYPKVFKDFSIQLRLNETLQGKWKLDPAGEDSAGVFQGSINASCHHQGLYLSPWDAGRLQETPMLLDSEVRDQRDTTFLLSAKDWASGAGMIWKSLVRSTADTE